MTKAHEATTLAQGIRDALDQLEALRPGGVARTRWTEAELEAFEHALGTTLHDDVRAYLLQVGEVATGFWSGEARRLGALDEQRRAALARPFPLTKGWVSPSLRDELDEAGLLERYEQRLYELPAGTSVDDGVVQVGCTSDGQAYRLVLHGEVGGTVWTDNRGNDYGEVLPAGRFLKLLEAWANEQLEAAQRAQAIERACAGRDFAALEKTFSAEDLRQSFAKLRKEASRGATLSPDVAWCMYELYRSTKDKELQAGQALVLAGEWARLRDYSAACLELLATEQLPRTRQAELTFKTHLAIASVKLGEPFTTEWPGEFYEYCHLNTALVPMALSRWTDAELRALFSRLRVDQPFWILSQLTAQGLRDHLDLLAEVAQAALPLVRAKQFPSASLVPGQASDVLAALEALPPSPARTRAAEQLRALDSDE